MATTAYRRSQEVPDLGEVLAQPPAAAPESMPAPPPRNSLRRTVEFEHLSDLGPSRSTLGEGRSPWPWVIAFVIALFAVLIVGFAIMMWRRGGSQDLTMTFIHVNDIHGHLDAEQFMIDPEAVSFSANVQGNVKVDHGGYPMLASLISQLASDRPNPVKIHAGDALTGTVYYSLFKGEADAKMMKMVCFDAFILGNHEFDGGDDTLAKFLGQLEGSEGEACHKSTPVLAANVVPGETSPLKGLLLPYFVKTFQGKEVGFVGIDTRNKTTLGSNPSDGTVLTDEFTAAQKYIDELKAKGIDRIVLLSHIGFVQDVDLAGRLSGVDVIVGGDSHSLLSTEMMAEVLGDVNVSTYPKMTVDKDGDPVCIVQAWAYGHLLSELSVTFDWAGKVTSCAGKPRVPYNAIYFVDAEGKKQNLAGEDLEKAKSYLAGVNFQEVVPDSEVTTVLSEFSASVEEKRKMVAGMATEDIWTGRWPGEELAALTWSQGGDLPNLVAKSFLWATRFVSDLAIINAGSIPVSIVAGPQTYNSLNQILPYSNYLVTMKLTGEEIRLTLEDSLAFRLESPTVGITGSYPYAHWLRFDINASANAGSRVNNLQTWSKESEAWVSLDVEKEYSLVTTNYLGYLGKDGFQRMMAGRDIMEIGLDYFQNFFEFAKAEVNLTKLPLSEYSTQKYTDKDGCDHSQVACGDCPGQGGVCPSDAALLKVLRLRKQRQQYMALV